MALIFGIIGIVMDKSKGLAILITVLAIAVVALFFLGQVINC